MNKKLFTAVSAALVLFLLGSCNFGFSGKETTPFDGIPDGELVTPTQVRKSYAQYAPLLKLITTL